MAKKTNAEEIQQQNMAEAISKTEKFFKENGKLIYGCVIAVLVLALAVLAYNRFYLQPRKVKAQAEMYKAEQWFAQENYELALNGDDNNLGFEDLLAKYGTKGGEAIYMYAGVCALQLGRYDDAINYLKKYKGEDTILLSRAQGCIGDAYVGLEDYQTALTWYEKAAKTASNPFSATYLLKGAGVAEQLGDKEKALSLYKLIKDQYPQAPEAMDIDKYITRIEF